MSTWRLVITLEAIYADPEHFDEHFHLITHPAEYGGTSSRFQPGQETIEILGVGEPPAALYKLARGL